MLRHCCWAVRVVVGVVLLNTLPACGEVTVQITTPAQTGRYIRGQTVPFECTVVDEGDHEYWVLWVFYDGTDDIH